MSEEPLPEVEFYVRRDCAGLRVGGQDILAGRSLTATQVQWLENLFGMDAPRTFTQRDLVLLMTLALEADRRGEHSIRVQPEELLPLRGWHARTGRDLGRLISNRFKGRRRADEPRTGVFMRRGVVWAPRARWRYEDKDGCEAYLRSDPKRGLTRGWMMRAVQGSVTRGLVDEYHTALARVVLPSSPLRRTGPVELALLRAWPSRRTRLGCRLQTLLALGATRAQILEISDRLVRPQPVDLGTTRAIVEEAWPSTNPFAPRDWPVDAIREYAVVFANTVPTPHLSRETAIVIGAHFARPILRDLGMDYAYGRRRAWTDTEPAPAADADSATSSSDDDGPQLRVAVRERIEALELRYAGDLGGAFIDRFGIRPAWIEDYVLLDLLSVSRGRATVAYDPAVMQGEAVEPARRLMSAACRASLRPQDERSKQRLEAELSAWDIGDPLWPALARHLGRMSTETDRALLEDRARNAQADDPRLQWALRYFVRGDVIMSNGSVLTLDEVCQDLGAKTLPFLETFDELAPIVEPPVTAGEVGDGPELHDIEREEDAPR